MEFIIDDWIRDWTIASRRHMAHRQREWKDLDPSRTQTRRISIKAEECKKFNGRVEQRATQHRRRVRQHDTDVRKNMDARGTIPTAVAAPSMDHRCRESYGMGWMRTAEGSGRLGNAAVHRGLGVKWQKASVAKFTINFCNCCCLERSSGQGRCGNASDSTRSVVYP
uniref:Uncharacterized protein n=1 Tax=Caenorhabditis japonica TaxID=281687 RepID=A0A8R1E8Y7_CAEJA